MVDKIEIGKFYVDTYDGEIFTIFSWEEHSTTRVYPDGTPAIIVYYTAWDCVTKTSHSREAYTRQISPDRMREISREQAYDTDFQKWIAKCYGVPENEDL